jgi:FADH2 O2-dependent halogenase
MIELDVDVAVIGAGFGGSLTALLLQRVGLKPALIERGSHPRFALGESSTPLADFVLTQLAERYDLPRIKPLANYGAWQRSYPELPCGLKRGFSYFQHQPGQAFAPRDDHQNELLVAASHASDDADTHWLRADFDHFLVREAQAAGIPYLDRTSLDDVVPGDRWTLAGRRGDEACSIRASFLIDASGGGGVLARSLGLRNDAAGFHTNSRALYGHFRDVKPWREILLSAGGRVADHPFDCDDAALHQILDGGWMWILRFNNGVTSAGFLLDAERWPLDESLTPADEWRRTIAKYPSLAEQFSAARLAAPEGGPRRSGRLQRRVERAAGPNWALLPTAAYTLDALHSTGNAHTLHGIERIVGVLERHWNRPELAAELECHQQMLQAEISLLDRFVHGCYLAFGRFELMAHYAMFYFAAATLSEARRDKLGGACSDAFLQATNPEFCAIVAGAHERLTKLFAGGSVGPREIDDFGRDVAAVLRPFNIAGLCDPAKRNMYPYMG